MENFKHRGSLADRPHNQTYGSRKYWWIFDFNKTLISFVLLKFNQHSPSLPPGFSASAAKHRGQHAVKSTQCTGTPSLNSVIHGLAFFLTSNYFCVFFFFLFQLMKKIIFLFIQSILNNKINNLFNNNVKK
jgi:hypothetical protein